MRIQKILLVAASILAATAGCAQQPAGDAAQPAPPVPTTTHSRHLATGPAAVPGDSRRETLIRDAERAYPTNSYAGLTVDGVTFVVHRVPLSQVEQIDAALRSRHPELQLTFADARHARTVLNQVTEKIKKDIPYWRANGVAVAAVAPRADGSGVTVMVRQAPADLAAAMRQRYEFPNLELKEGEIIPA